MNDAASKAGTQEIVVDEVFPHAPETIWKTLTNGALMARWLAMTPTGFEPVKGKRFTYQTTPGGAWDGVIHCEVLEAIGERTAGLQLEKRARGKRRLRRAARHCRYVYPLQGRKRNAPSPRPLRLRAAEERTRFHEHERRLEEGCPDHRRHRCGAGSSTKH